MNQLFSDAFVGGLARAGLRSVCIAPGSRSTPLTLAFDAHPDVNTFVHLDERCAGFFALGLAQAGGRPVAVVSTSGTAALEFHAAAGEAMMAGIPLLLLTADRPPELRHSGANQTIDQVKMFGDHVLWSVDAGLPEREPPAAALRNVRTLAARAYAAADGLRKGPVHVNLPFRKPLEPAAPYAACFDGPESTVSVGRLAPTGEQIDRIAGIVDAHERGWIVCGPWAGRPPRRMVRAVAELARRAGYPIFADALSGLRFGEQCANAPVLGSFEGFLQGRPGMAAPEVVIRFGAVPTSKSLNDYLERTAPAQQIQVRSSGVWADDSHRLRQFLRVDETEFCRRLTERLRPRTSGGGTQGPVDGAAGGESTGPGRVPVNAGAWAAQALAADRRCSRIQSLFLGQRWFDASAAAAAVEALPARANLFLGNSLPVRHVDQFVGPSAKEVDVFGNRGASGIDGIVSSALGVAAAEPEIPLLLLIGDISFYHDLNGLLAVGGCDLGNVTIVVLHNDGGGLFRRLPVAKGHGAFDRLFVTPHGLEFGAAAAMYGLDYVRIPRSEDGQGAREMLTDAVKASLDGSRATVIEAHTDGARDERLRRELGRMIRESKEECS